MMDFLIYKLNIKKRIEMLPIIMIILSPISLLSLKKLIIKISKKKLKNKIVAIFKKLAPNKEPIYEIKTINKNKKIKNNVVSFMNLIILNILSLFNNYTKKGKRWIKIWW